MSLEQSPETQPIPFQYETVYGTQMLQLAEKLRAKESRWTLIFGKPNLVVLDSGADSLVEQIYRDFNLPMTQMSPQMIDISKISKEQVDG